MPDEELYDLIVMGAGPGGYVAAIRAAQLGMKTAVIERGPTLGGVCLNEGCIPSKALLDSSELFSLARNRFSVHGIMLDSPPSIDVPKMMARKDDVVKKLTDGIAFLFKKNKITWIRGNGRLTKPSGDLREVEVTADGETKKVRGKRVLIATGGAPVELPNLRFNGTTIVGSAEALCFDRVPEHLLVVGGGYIGLEIGSVWRRLGARVTVVEMLPNLLPTMDGQCAGTLQRALKKQGIEFMMETRVEGGEEKDGRVVVRVKKGDETEEIDCDKVLVAVGRRGVTTGIGLEEAGVALDDRGRVRVDENFQTSVPGIYAIGDIIPGAQLAHKASEEGVVCVERLAGEKSEVEYDYLPGICYTWPELASVGKTEEQLKSDGTPYSAGKFLFSANGRARCMDETEGLVKVLAHADTGCILGVHILGPRASDMIAEAVAVMTFEGTVQDVAMTFHAHPTLSEAFKEAALDAMKRAIHA